MTCRLAPTFADWSTAALLIASLVPWIVIQWNRSVNGNIAWLSLCAQRWLDGTALSEGCYDTNPPLSILLYTPPILLSRLTEIETHYAIYILVLALIAFSSLSLWAALRNEEALDQPEKYIFLATYLLSITILSSISFADKDHIIAMLLPPLVLTQRAITRKTSISAIIKYPALAFGTLTILIKPHFVIIPAAMLLHRLITQKRLSVVMDPDALILGGFALVYILMLFTLFQDFLNIMLPDILRYYLPYNNAVQTWIDLKPLLALSGLSLVMGYLVGLKNAKKQTLLTSLNISALACLLVYYWQMKGLAYQILPVYAFLVPALALSLYSVISAALKNEKYKPYSAFALLCLCIALVYIRAPLRPNYPTHEDYKNAELTHYLLANCGNPCAYLVTHENMEIVSQTAFYAKGTYATRFPGYWYIALLEGTPFPKPASERETNNGTVQEKDRMRFAEYTAKDLERFRPNVVMILTTPPDAGLGPPFDYFDYFSGNPDFAKQTKNYIKTETFETDRAYYFRDTRHDYKHILRWDVYKRTHNEGASNTPVKNNGSQP